MHRKKQSPHQIELAAPSNPILLIDIRAAAQMLGVSVFAVRNLCWHRETARVLKPVRHGLKFLFSPVALRECAEKLVSGEIQFPATPIKAKQKRVRA